MSKKSKRSKKMRLKGEKDYKCSVCGQTMTMQGGYADTGLCGPCATGEAATLEEFGETW